MFANLVGWEEIATQKLTSVKVGPAKMAEYVLITKMHTSVNVQKVTVVITVNIMGRYAIEILANMEALA